MRRDRARDHQRGENGQFTGAVGGPTRRYECRGGKKADRQVGSRGHRSGRSCGRGPEGGGGGERKMNALSRMIDQRDSSGWSRGGSPLHRAFLRTATFCLYFVSQIFAAEELSRDPAK